MEVVSDRPQRKRSDTELLQSAMVTGREHLQKRHNSLGRNGVVLKRGLLEQVDAAEERDVPAEPLQVAVAQRIVVQLEASHGKHVLTATPPTVHERLPQRGVESFQKIATNVDEVEVAHGGEGEGFQDEEERALAELRVAEAERAEIL